HPLEEVGDGLALLDGHDRLFPALGVTPVAADAAHLAAHVHGVHVGHRHFEGQLHGFPYLVLVRVRRDLGRVLVHLRLAVRALLGDQRPPQYVPSVHDRNFSSTSILSRVRIRLSYLSRSSAFRFAAGSVLTVGMFRAARTVFSSDVPMLISALPSRFRAPSSATT